MKERINTDGVLLHDQRAHLFREDYSGKLESYCDSAFKYGRMRIRETVDQMLSDLSPKSKILDMGCGTGYFLNYLSKKGHDVYGIDLSQEMIRHLKEIYGEMHVRHGDLRQLPYEDESFDAVISIETLRYFDDVQSVLREGYRVLKKGGIALFTAAPFHSLNFYGYFNRLCRKVNFRKGISCYQSFETVSSFEKYLKEVRFSKVSIHGYFFGPYFLLDKVMPSISRQFMKWGEPMDKWLSQKESLRNFSNHLVAVVKRGD